MLGGSFFFFFSGHRDSQRYRSTLIHEAFMVWLVRDLEETNLENREPGGLGKKQVAGPLWSGTGWGDTLLRVNAH